ncbi:hypothetical protein TDIS_1721 [Thermosulfurimonas dismutans]|uniref:Uncharacterized protein n=1 Tax=Thermosulfurimonas dismutans TaxID=999894 RepID=A0A179D3C7_9BACT|nr:hypothetical protein TDIS_1721 [Thermosulfurimonas dismutans]
MKIGIGTNVFYYAIDCDNPFHLEAREKLEALVKKRKGSHDSTESHTLKSG